jgi:hypothetical protein
MVTFLEDTSAYESYNGTSWIGFGGSGILQVVSVIMPDDFSASIATAARASVTGLTASITPSSSSSKILILGQVTGSTSAHGWYSHLFRGATEISSGTIEGSRTGAVSAGVGSATLNGLIQSNVFFTFLDSPSTSSSVTYSIEVSHLSGVTQTVYVNRSMDDTNTAANRRTVSTITLMEVAG